MKRKCGGAQKRLHLSQIRHCKYSNLIATHLHFLEKLKKMNTKNPITEDLVKLKAGQVEPYLCADGNSMESVAALLTRMKRLELMPEGVVGYEHKKYYGKNIIIVRAMGEGDVKVLNRKNKKS